MTTTEALSNASTSILARFEATEGKLSKNGVLDCLAKAIMSDRASWGGVVQKEIVHGNGVPPVNFLEKLEAGNNEEGPASERVLADPPIGSPVLYIVGDMKITEYDVQGLKVGFELLGGRREDPMEDGDPLYGLFRPLLSAGANRNIFKTGNYAANEGELLRDLLRAVLLQENEGIMHSALVIWVASRFPVEGLDDRNLRLFQIHECLVREGDIERVLYATSEGSFDTPAAE